MISFGLAAFFLVLTPGPAVLTVAGFGASYGFRRSVVFVLGIMLGANLVMLAVMSGLAAVLLSAPGLRLVLLAGSTAFLFYLAALIAFAGTKIAFIEARHPPGVLSAVVLQVLNPKAYAVNTALFTGFNFAPEAPWFEIGAKLLIANMVWIPLHFLWLWAGVRLHALELSERWQRVINLGMAAALVAVAVLSAVTLLFA